MDADRPDAWTEVTTPEQLTALLGEPLPRVRDKVRPALHPLDAAWLRASPYVVLATADADGRCDASPKGDPAGGLVHVLDERTVALAERPGNRRADGYRNVLTNPRAALLATIPGRGDLLRVAGRARLVSEAPFLDAMVVAGHRPVLALVLDVEEVFHHCAKAALRAGLWDPATWAPEGPDGSVPRRAVLARELEQPGADLADLDRYYGEGYARLLYG